MKLDVLLSIRIRICLRSFDQHIFRAIVSPQRAVAAADAAVTFIERMGGRGECETDGGAVACCCHGRRGAGGRSSGGGGHDDDL